MTREFRPYYRSSSFKMALLFTVLLGLSVGILSYFGYYFSRGHFIDGTEAVIESEIQHFAQWQDRQELPQAVAVMKDREDLVLYLTDRAGAFVEGNITSLPDNVSLLAEGTILFTHADKPYAARIHTFPDGTRLMVGVDIGDMARSYAWMKWLSILSIIFTVAVIAISYMISVFVVSRTNRIAQTAKEIMDTGNLSRRIEVDSRWDDLSYVAQVLNAFLGRVESLVENVRQVSDNIAHDLRTPLTRLRNDLEKLRDGDPVRPERYDTVIGEADQILTMFSALLRISNIEAAQQKHLFVRTDLALIGADVYELYDPLAEEKGVKLDLSATETTIMGDRDLLFQALANLVDNAIKFTPSGGSVRIDIEASAVIRVCDTGPGIENGEEERIFRRFYRAEGSRSTKGNGLGLSMVEAVVQLHAGQIQVCNLFPGLMMEMRFRQMV